MKEPEKSAATYFITGPLVHAVELFLTLAPVEGSHHDLLREHVPIRFGLEKVSHEPVFLPSSEHRRFRIENLSCHRLLVIAVGLVGPILTGIENLEVGESAVATLPVECHVRTLRERTPS